MRNVLPHCVYSLCFLWRAENLAILHSDDIIPTLKTQKNPVEMLSVMYIVFLCGLLLLTAACNYLLGRGRAQITGLFHVFVFSMHLSEGSGMFQRESGDFSPFPHYSRAARPSAALGRFWDESSMNCRYTKPCYLSSSLSSLSANIGQTLWMVQLSGV